MGATVVVARVRARDFSRWYSAWCRCWVKVWATARNSSSTIMYMSSADRPGCINLGWVNGVVVSTSLEAFTPEKVVPGVVRLRVCELQHFSY